MQRTARTKSPKRQLRRPAAPRVARAPAAQPARPRRGRRGVGAASLLPRDGPRPAEPRDGAAARPRARRARPRPQRAAGRGRLRARLPRARPRGAGAGRRAPRAGVHAAPAGAVPGPRPRRRLEHRHEQRRRAAPAEPLPHARRGGRGGPAQRDAALLSPAGHAPVHRELGGHRRRAHPVAASRRHARRRRAGDGPPARGAPLLPGRPAPLAPARSRRGQRALPRGGAGQGGRPPVLLLDCSPGWACRTTSRCTSCAWSASSPPTPRARRACAGWRRTRARRPRGRPRLLSLFPRRAPTWRAAARRRCRCPRPSRRSRTADSGRAGRGARTSPPRRCAA